MGSVRLELRLAGQSEWLEVFDPRDWTVFVTTTQTVESGEALRIDLDVDGWRVTLHGSVIGHKPDGVVVAIGSGERDKINYVNAFVRGGLLDLREKRRFPLRLAVTYGAVEGPAATFTRDINEHGVFLLTDKPLPETSQIHMLITVPGKAQPLSLMGKVSHAIEPGSDEPAGMGIAFDGHDAQREELAEIIQQLLAQPRTGE